MREVEVGERSWRDDGEGNPPRHSQNYLAKEKIHTVLAVLRGENSITEFCRREGIWRNAYYR